MARPVLTYLQRKTRKVRSVLAAGGMVETLNWSFITKEQATLFGGGQPELALDNPISVEMSDMRPSLLSGLLAAAKRNGARGFDNTALFEIGNCYAGVKPEDQNLYVAGIRCGSAVREGEGRFWQGNAENVDLFDAKTDFMSVLQIMGIRDSQVQFNRNVPAWAHPGRAGNVQQGPKRQFGWFGELHPEILSWYGLEVPVVGFEIKLSMFTAPKNEALRTRPALVSNDLQPVRRDFAFVVKNDVLAEDVMKSAAAAEKKLIIGVSVFDLFEGDSIGEGQKSIGIEVTLQPLKQTLTDKEIEAVCDKIVKTVEKKTGGTLR